MQLVGPSAAGFMYSDTGGSGPSVVFLHGVLMNGTLWNDIVDKLCDRYRCVVPELPFGAHRTPMPDGADLRLESLVRMVADFLVELDLRDVTLVCNDWGGAQLVVSPGGSDRVANLVLVSCEAFDNYPPGLPGRLLCLIASLPGGTYLTAQLLRPRVLRHLPITFGALSKKRVPDDQFLGWIESLRHNRKVRRDLAKVSALRSTSFRRSSGRATVDVPSTVGGAGHGRDVSRFTGSAREERAPAILARPSSRLAGAGHVASSLRRGERAFVEFAVPGPPQA